MILTDKKVLRKEILLKIDSIQSKDKKNKIVLTKLKKLIEANGNVKKVFCYIEIKNEIPISKLFKFFHDRNIDIFVPYYKNNKWVVSQLLTNTKLILSKLNILQPQDSKIYSSLVKAGFESTDIAFVPGLAFDKKGNRLGRGKGIYDYYLSDIKSIKIGICYSQQIVNLIPREPHDIKVDQIITEN